MQITKRLLLTTGIGLAVVGGGVGIAAASASSSPTAKSATAATAASAPAGTATINVTTASVNGQSEKVLVDAHGSPLYTFASDTTATSHVSGGLAALWPPLVSASPTESGTSGNLTVVPDANGQQVQYDGHFLYTFVDDTPGQVTGQGVQGFSIATPSLGSGTAAVTPAPPTTKSSGSYGYSY